jgi:hypothetical protein
MAKNKFVNMINQSSDKNVLIELYDAGQGTEMGALVFTKDQLKKLDSAMEDCEDCPFYYEILKETKDQEDVSTEDMMNDNFEEWIGIRFDNVGQSFNPYKIVEGLMNQSKDYISWETVYNFLLKRGNKYHIDDVDKKYLKDLSPNGLLSKEQLKQAFEKLCGNCGNEEFEDFIDLYEILESRLNQSKINQSNSFPLWTMTFDGGESWNKMLFPKDPTTMTPQEISDTISEIIDDENEYIVTSFLDGKCIEMTDKSGDFTEYAFPGCQSKEEAKKIAKQCSVYINQSVINQSKDEYPDKLVDSLIINLGITKSEAHDIIEEVLSYFDVNY